MIFLAPRMGPHVDLVLSFSLGNAGQFATLATLETDYQSAQIRLGLLDRAGIDERLPIACF